ncbi:uncharacterized protein LOC113077284 [Carassius auratus]|uniref:Uncharacterized protein LOC113077284 n=1 Tax=Carassius auratus TaxID=7957 RepID=A0A6P6NB48_CARAU|nr:uncharacterized protein LOC113077284 [Carassius auratus]
MSLLTQRNGLKVTWSPAPSVTQIITETSSRRSVFQKGDGKEPTVTIYKPDNVKDNISHVCEVTSPKLGDVYVMWKVGDESYREGTTSAPTHQKDSTSVLSILTMTKEEYNVITCAVIHANMTNRRAPLQVSTSKTKLSLTMKPPIQKELFVNDTIVLQAVVSGDVNDTVQVTSVSCKVKDERVPNGNITTGNVESSDTSQFKKIYDVTVDTEKWFEGHVVTCTIRDTNNNRDIEQKISFQKGDGKEPTVTIYKPDNVKDNISHVCEVTSPKLGDVYVMWKVGDESYREGTTSAPTHQKDSTSVLSILTMTKEEYNVITCAVIHANMTNRRAPLQVSTSKTKLSLTMKPPIQKELFVNDTIVLQAVVSGDVNDTVQVTSVSCKVKDERVPNGKIKTGNVESSDTSQFKKIYDVTVDTEKWFEGHVVTCTIRDTNNNRDIEQEISFQKGDGKKPTVTIYKPDNVKDNISHVCEVTSPKLGDVYVMWKVGDESYREGTTSAPTHQKDSTSVLSILTMTKEEYNVITCAVIHANMTNRRAPLQVSTSKTKLSLTMKPPIQKELFANDKIVLQAVVSGDVNDTVQVTSVSCKVKDERVPNGKIKTGNVESSDTSQFKKIYDVTVDTEKWFDGHVVTCTIHDTNNNRDIEQKISFQKGDGKEPTVTIYKPDNVKDNISHVCEVTSPKLGDVYVMWKVGDESYREGTTSAPTHQKDSTSVLSILTMTKEEYNVITCAVIHANMTNRRAPLQVSTSKTKLSLTMKPPIQKELFANDTIVLQAVVSGDVKNTVQVTSVSCKVKDERVPNGKIKTGNVESSDTSQFKKIYDVTVDTEKWFEGHVVTCTIRDTNNNRDIEQKISFQKGDGKEPTVTIFKPDNVKDNISHVCEVTSPKLGDVYVMWKVGDESYREGTTSAPTHQKDSASVLSILTMTKEEYNVITCAVIHANMTNRRAPLQVSTSKTKLSLTMKPPIQKELFVNDTIVLQAVVSGDVKNTVQVTSVSCKVKDELVPNGKIKTGNVEFSTDTSQFNKFYDVTVDTEKWFEGHVVTCTIRDTNNNRDIEQKISFQKGDGKKPTVTIYKPDNITDPLSHVCEVTSPKLGDVYVMWKVGDESYREGTTSAPTHQKDSASVLSILTMTKEEYEKPSTTITCAVIHAKTEDLRAPLQVSTSKSETPEPETGFALDCNKDVLEEDEFRSLWSTATSFIFLFLFSLTYSAVLSFFKVKQ